MMRRQLAFDHEQEKGKMTDNERVQLEQLKMAHNHDMLVLAEKEYPLACFSYAKDIFINLKNGGFNHLASEEKSKYIEYCVKNFKQAADKGISSAFFYLGLIHLEGEYADRDVETAIDYYVKGAAKNNAFCFFELSRLYSGESGEVVRDPYLQFLYLKRSAEEGYVTAQHLLGVAYHQG